MEKFKVSFEANNQQLKSIGTKHASDTYADIEATFVLGEKWTDMDSVSAVWWNDFTRIATVLDSQGKCIVPHEVLTRKGCVRVNLVGSIVEGDELITRLTSYSAEAVQVNEKIKLTGSETSEITPSQYEQFVANVKADADRAEAGATASANSADEAEASAQNASESASASAVSASDSARSATASAGYAQDASEIAVEVEVMKNEVELAKDKVLGMRATAETLEAGSDATASYSDGLLTLGIPRGDQGIQGIQGETGATPNLTIGTVETLEPTEDATATITGTAENPVLNLGLPKGDTGEVSLEDLGALLPTDTASGDIASITDGQSVVPVKSLKVTLEPIQDLHGYDKPWSGGNGKNKLPSIGATFTDSGVTWTLNDDGSVKLSGTATANSVYDFGRNVVELEAGTYFASETASGYTVAVFSIVGGTASVIKAGGGQFTLTEKTSVFMRVLVASGTTPNTTIYPQIEKSASFTSYEPYSNICPISGHTECVTSVSGVNVWDEEWERGAISGGLPVQSQKAIRSKNFSPCLPNTTYFCKCGNYTNQYYMAIWWYDENEQLISVTWVCGITATSPSDAHYFKISTNTSTYEYGTTYNHDISINYPSTDHEYHAYDGTTYTTDLGRTVYGGTLDVVSGEMVVDRVIKTFDGTDTVGLENWRPLDNSSAWLYRPNVTEGLLNIQTSIQNLSDLKSDKLPTVAYSPLYSTDSIGISLVGSEAWGVGMRVNDTSLRTESAINAWLAENPITVCYKLANPQTYQLTPQEIKLLLGTNNVWSDGNVTLVYSADIQKWVEKKLNANSTTSMLTMSRPMVQTETTETEETETETAETE